MNIALKNIKSFRVIFIEACLDKIDKISEVGYLTACCGVIQVCQACVAAWGLKSATGTDGGNC
jgi:hypothetical protein